MFERLIASLSSGFTGVGSDGVGERIRSGLEQLVEFLDCDRGTLFERTAEQGKVSTVETYAREGIPPLGLTLINTSLPWYTHKIWTGEPLVLNHLPEDLPAEALQERAYCRRIGLRSNLTIPIRVSGHILFAITIGNCHDFRTWTPEVTARIRLVGEIFANSLVRQRLTEKRENDLARIRQLQEQLQRDCTYLQEEIQSEHNFDTIIGRSNAIQYVLMRVKQVAPSDAAVLLMGATGTGKELVARAIHRISKRNQRPLVKINCAALAPSVIESELFGHEKGAFSGALERRVGRFEYADGATLFLDEIGELPLELQPKLLRVLEDGEFERIGASATHTCNVRIIAATNRDLEAEVKAGSFRSDLWYRLNGFPITVPPLTQRRDDIPLLARHFVEIYSRRSGKQISAISEAQMEQLTAYDWPGNVRELKNFIERSILISTSNTLQLSEITPSPILSPAPTSKPDSLDALQCQHIRETLDRCYWKIEGPGGAAKMLGLKPSTLRYRMKKFDIHRPEAQPS